MKKPVMGGGLVSIFEIARAVADLFREGLPPGDKTGWPSVDAHYTVVPGQLTIITGWPGAGKSEWLDALVVNLMHQGWKTAFYSPENQPAALHLAKLLEKVIGKPFGAGPTERMSPEEMSEVLTGVLQPSFVFVNVPEDGALNATRVMETALPWFDQFPEGTKRALVIDPWNELEHWRPPQLSETEYVSMTLQRIRTWARSHGIHVFLVAHPQKMRRDDSGKLPVPKPDMISGSQHFWNKADNAITVWRTMDASNYDDHNVDIHIQKVRFKHVGRPGIVTLKFDRVTGRYSESAVEWNDLSAARKKRDRES